MAETYTATFDSQTQTYIDNQVERLGLESRINEAKHSLKHCAGTAVASVAAGVAGLATGNLLVEHGALAGLAAAVYEGGKNVHALYKTRKELNELENQSVTIEVSTPEDIYGQTNTDVTASVDSRDTQFK